MEDPFTAAEHAAWSGLLGTFGHLSALIDADLRERFGISHVEFEVLLRLALSRGGRMRIQDLAEASILTRSGMSRAIGRLERAGLVGRIQAAEDRRGAYAELTDSGRDLFARAAAGHVAFVRARFLSLFSEEELEQMATFWQRVAQSGGDRVAAAKPLRGSA
jgi:DNA-binding MarR family transcriptional regulator